ncbi:MAG: glycosyltransferase family 2 protein [Candidatus Pacebacteria bacterium]|nr:glycosyltransferase family 2 protein [Candidatus Paceibacterota bacterium]
MISIIIPAFNEEKRLPITLHEIFDFLKSEKMTAEIIVVNDGSFDNTSSVVENLFKEYSRLKLINLEKNQGKGFAVKTGILSAEGKFIIFLDSDNSTSLSHIKDVKNMLEQGYDIVIGSREINGAKIIQKQPYLREKIGKIFNFFTKTIKLSEYEDTQCGFKGFKEDIAKNIFSKTKINGFAFDIEVLCIAKKSNYKIKEIPVYWKDNIDSKVSVKNIWNIFWDIWKIKINLIQGRYGK